MDPDKCFGPDGSVWAEIQSRKASARVGGDRSVDLRPPANNQPTLKVKWDQEGLIYTLGSEKFGKTQILKKSKLMIEDEGEKLISSDLGQGG